jgi:hypothetical protein
LEYDTSEELIGKDWFDNLPPEINNAQPKQGHSKKSKVRSTERNITKMVVTKSGKKKS